MTDIPWWISSLVWLAGHAAILCGVSVLIWRWRGRRPIAANLLLAAAACDGASLVFTSAVTMLAFLRVFSDSGISIDESGPNLLDPQIILTILRQIVNSGLEMVSWSLIAWAVLMQPDAPQRRGPEAASP